jgi:hypothetical protein
LRGWARTPNKGKKLNLARGKPRAFVWEKVMKTFVRETIHRSWISALAFGIFLGSFSILLVLLFFGFGKFDNIWVVLNSSALIGTGATLFAGYWAWQAVQDQILKSEEISERDRIENLRAERALLPFALDEISQVTMYNLELHLPSDLKESNRNLRHIDRSIFYILKHCIKYSDQISGERLSLMLRTYQVLMARHKPDYVNHPLQPHKVNDAEIDNNQIHQIINWAVLNAICGSAFGYARGRVSQIPASINGISLHGTFSQFGADEEDYPLLYSMLGEKDDAGRLEM